MKLPVASSVEPKRIDSEEWPAQKVSRLYAQRLREAGYPQEILYGAYYFADDAPLANVVESNAFALMSARQFWKAPTAYELMCACIRLGYAVRVESQGSDPDMVDWLVTAGSERRIGHNLADNMADIWIEAQAGVH